MEINLLMGTFGATQIMGSLKILEIKTKHQSNFTWLKYPENVIKLYFFIGMHFILEAQKHRSESY